MRATLRLSRDVAVSSGPAHSWWVGELLLPRYYIEVDLCPCLLYASRCGMHDGPHTTRWWQVPPRLESWKSSTKGWDRELPRSRYTECAFDAVGTMFSDFSIVHPAGSSSGRNNCLPCTCEPLRNDHLYSHKQCTWCGAPTLARNPNLKCLLVCRCSDPRWWGMTLGTPLRVGVWREWWCRYPLALWTPSSSGPCGTWTYIAYSIPRLLHYCRVKRRTVLHTLLQKRIFERSIVFLGKAGIHVIPPPRLAWCHHHWSPKTLVHESGYMFHYASQMVRSPAPKTSTGTSSGLLESSCGPQVDPSWIGNLQLEAWSILITPT